MEGVARLQAWPRTVLSFAKSGFVEFWRCIVGVGVTGDDTETRFVEEGKRIMASRCAIKHDYTIQVLHNVVPRHILGSPSSWVNI